MFRRVVDEHAALLEHFFEVAVPEPMSQTAAHALQNDVRWIAIALELIDCSYHEPLAHPANASEPFSTLCALQGKFSHPSMRLPWLPTVYAAFLHPMDLSHVDVQ